MSWLSWIIFGALAGWAANLIVGGRNRRPQGCIVSVLVGIVGAALGGYLYRLATGRDKSMDSFDFDIPSFAVAVLGAVVLLAVLRLIVGAGRGGRG